MLRPVSSLALILALTACGGGGGGRSHPPPPPPPTFTIGGTVTGLAGTGLVLRLNNATDLTLNANGQFTGPAYPQGTAYTVAVRDQPTQPWQTCTVGNGTGTLTGPVNNVAINCTTNTYHVGVTVTGLTGVGLVLQVNGGTAAPILMDGAYSLPGNVASGTNYGVTIQTQPGGQQCAVANGTGPMADRDVIGIAVTCPPGEFAYTVRDLAARDIACGTNSYELYAAVNPPSGPAIMVIDSRNGDTLRTVATPQLASPLAVSDDGQFLYAGLGASGSIRRYAIPAMTSNLDFPIGVDQAGQPLEPHDIRVAPGNAHTVAVTRAYKNVIPWDYGLAVYDDGVARASTVGDAAPLAGVHPDGALWSADGTKIYSLSMLNTPPRYYESAVSANGVVLQGEIPLPQERSFGAGLIDLRFAYSNYQMAGGRLYSSTGTSFDPQRRVQLGAFRTLGQGFAVDVARNKAFFASSGFLLPITFESFDLGRLTPVSTHSPPFIPVPWTTVKKLLRCGSNALAAVTDSQLVLVNGTFVTDAAGAGPIPAPALVESTGSSGAYQYRIYDLPAHDVQWDATRDRLYAAVNGKHRVHGNSIAAINVDLNLVTGGVSAGSEPMWMSMSDDATTLYVTNYASSSIERVDLTTMRLDTTFMLNFPGQGPGYALAAEARPGEASTFAYIEHYPATSKVFTRMIAGLTLRPQSFDQQMTTLAFTDANTVFANDTWSSTIDFRELAAGATGLQLVRSDQNLFNVADRMRFTGSLLYADAGYSIDPATRTVVRTYNSALTGTSKAFRANPARDRGYMAFQDAGNQTQLIVFRLSDATLLAAVKLPLSVEQPISLTSMNASGVAITTTAGKTVIVTGPDL